jgi:hypothetical protein
MRLYRGAIEYPKGVFGDGNGLICGEISCSENGTEGKVGSAGDSGVPRLLASHRDPLLRWSAAIKVFADS